MPKVSLEVRSLETGESGRASFENEDDARAWLMERPRMTEVLGVTSVIDQAMSLSLRDAMRPLDTDERVHAAVLADAERRQAEAALDELRARDVQAKQAYREAMKMADPDRLMILTYESDRGLALADEADPRAITQVARDAAQAWIDERQDWVKDRGQIVGEAMIAVWPGPLPTGEERIREGSFVPMTAPPAVPKVAVASSIRALEA